MAKSNAPIVILVRPQLGENIGAVARAMSNFGLAELRLVAPRDGWPNRKATEMASGGTHIIEAATVYPDFAAAMADIHIAYATTARTRDMEKRVLTPDNAMQEIAPRRRGGKSPKTALVFGPERTGLENEEIALCDTLITIPTSPKNSSLNLGQSMVILGYEWWRTSAEASAAKDTHVPAPKADMVGLFTQLESYLDDINYYRVAQKKTVMWQNLQTTLLRGRWSAQEVRSFRGMLRALWERKRRNN